MSVLKSARKRSSRQYGRSNVQEGVTDSKMLITESFTTQLSGHVFFLSFVFSCRCFQGSLTPLLICINICFFCLKFFILFYFLKLFCKFEFSINDSIDHVLKTDTLTRTPI
uniref:Uncharacterized protein n=1 Tax=Octopus bimaculoides TaxID=37653 RepID=A0A0L8FPK0_OCTBM